MDALSFFIGLASLVLSLYFGIKRKNYPFRLYYKQTIFCYVVSQTGKLSKHIKLLVGDMQYDKNVVKFQGELENIGDEDLFIDSKQGISIDLEQNYTWIDGTATIGTEDLLFEASNDNRHAVFYLTKLRRGEKVIIAGYLHCESETICDEMPPFTFSHEIRNLEIISQKMGFFKKHLRRIIRFLIGTML